MTFSDHHSKILYLEASINYTWIVYSSGNKDLMTITLKKVHASLPSDEFVRIHRKYIVNEHYIEKISKENVLLINGEILPIARRRMIKSKKI